MAEKTITIETTIAALVESKKYATLRDILVTMNPVDVAAVFEELPQSALPLLFRLLPKELAAEAFAEMETAEGAGIPGEAHLKCAKHLHRRIDLKNEAGELPVYLPSDNELCLRAGRLDDGTLLAAVFNLSYDPEEETVLYLEKEPASIVRLDENGEEVPVIFRKTGENIYTLEVSCQPLYPTVLLIR